MSSGMTWRPAFPEPPVKTMRFPEGAIVEKLESWGTFLYLRRLTMELLVLASAWVIAGSLLPAVNQLIVWWALYRIWGKGIGCSSTLGLSRGNSIFIGVIMQVRVDSPTGTSQCEHGRGEDGSIQREVQIEIVAKPTSRSIPRHMGIGRDPPMHHPFLFPWYD